MAELDELFAALRQDQGGIDILAKQMEADRMAKTIPQPFGGTGDEDAHLGDDVKIMSETIDAIIVIIESQQKDIDALKAKVLALAGRNHRPR